GWILHAAAITASPAWEGPPAPDDGAELGRVLLEQRRASYQRLTEQLATMTSVAMSDLGRRPRAGVDPQVLARLVHALMDGAVLRVFIEPGALPPELVAEAMYRLAVAFSEEGPADDPRKPTDERHPAAVRPDAHRRRRAVGRRAGRDRGGGGGAGGRVGRRRVAAVPLPGRPG
ncbi:MAG TPA: TetR family transcriptional regulator C-terminal domain-containing protein, partial [Acidimicrobiales bacterium]